MTITVYHLKTDDSFNEESCLDYLNFNLSPQTDAIEKKIKAGLYIKVAEVNSDNLETAWELTNSIESHWTQNKGVAAFGEKQRSTSVGDLMEHNGVLNVVVMMGFAQLPFSMQEAHQPPKIKM